MNAHIRNNGSLASFKVAYYSLSEAFLADSSTQARQQRAENITRVLKGNPTKTINMALVRKNFPLIFRVIIFKRAECSSSLLRVDKKFLLRNRSILPLGRLCFLDNADLRNTSGHAISSEQRNNERRNNETRCCCFAQWQIRLRHLKENRHKVPSAA